MSPRGSMYPRINQVFEFWAIVIIVQVSAKYMIIKYLDPYPRGCAE